MSHSPRTISTLSALEPKASTRALVGGVLASALVATLTPEVQSQDARTGRCTISQVFFHNLTMPSYADSFDQDVLNHTDYPGHPFGDPQVEATTSSACIPVAQRTGRAPNPTEFTVGGPIRSTGIAIPNFAYVVPVTLTCTPRGARRLAMSGNGIYHLDSLGSPVITVHFNNFANIVHTAWPTGLQQRSVPCQFTALGQTYRHPFNISLR